MASTNGFDSSEFESASVSCSSLVIASSSCSVLLCPLLSSAELETSSDASSVASSSCSSLDGVIELPSPSPLHHHHYHHHAIVEPDDEPVDPPLLSSPALPSSSVLGELFDDDSSLLPNFSGAGVICARADLEPSSAMVNKIVLSNSRSPNINPHLGYWT